MEAPDQQKYGTSDRGQIFEMLSNDRRRRTIRYCKQQGEVTLSELAEHIASIEQGKSVEELDASERKRVYTSLQQTHLDRLADAGFLELDGDRIRLTEDAEELEVYMDIVPEGSVPWSVYYLGLSAIAAAIAGAFSTGLVPGELLGWRVGMAGIVGLFLLSAVVHVIDDRRYRLDQFDQSDSD